MATIEIIGNAGGDAELKFIKGAKGDFAIANLSIAETPREYKDGVWVNGETVWWKISATGQLAEQMADTALKGVRLFVKGDLKAFEYKGKDGEIKQGFEVRAKTIATVLTGERKASNQQPKAESNEWPF